MVYRGGPIIQDDNFLKRLPLSLDSRQRLILEGLVHAADSIAAAYSHIYATVLECAQNNGQISPLKRAMMFNCAWGIVDDFYATRQLLGRLQPDAAPQPGGFFEVAQDFVLLRNRMDHLAQNVVNLVNARGIRRPIFGSISFFYISDADLVIKNEHTHVISAQAFNISSGSISAQDLLPFTIPGGELISPPIDRIKFSAFDRDIDLAQPITKLQELVGKISANVENECRENIKRQLGDGEKLDQALNQVAPFGVTIILDLKFPREGD